MSVTLQWRNKPSSNPPPECVKGWHHYGDMSESEAASFMEHKAWRSNFFEFRIGKPKKVKVAPAEVPVANPAALPLAAPVEVSPTPLDTARASLVSTLSRIGPFSSGLK